MINSYLIRVYGDVQGVNYRYFAKKEARKLGLIGWVKNEQQGSVLAFVQGEAKQVKRFIDWAKKGSPMATVKEVMVEKANLDECIREFEIR